MEVATLITAVVSAIAAFATLLFSLYTYRRTLVHDRKQATLDAYNILQEQSFDQLNLIMPAEIRSIVQHPTSEEYKRVSAYAARLEHFCVGVNTGIYDRNTVYALGHGYLDGKMLLSRIEPIIEKKNHGEKDYYENIHKLLAWMNRKAK